MRLTCLPDAPSIVARIRMEAVSPLSRAVSEECTYRTSHDVRMGLGPDQLAQRGSKYAYVLRVALLFGSSSIDPMWSRVPEPWLEDG